MHKKNYKKKDLEENDTKAAEETKKL